MRKIRHGSFLLASLGLNSTYFNAVLRTHFKIDDDTVDDTVLSVPVLKIVRSSHLIDFCIADCHFIWL